MFTESAADAALFLMLLILLNVDLLAEPVVLEIEDPSLVEALSEDDFRRWPVEDEIEPRLECIRSCSFRFLRSPTLSTVSSVQDKSAVNIAVRTPGGMGV